MVRAGDIDQILWPLHTKNLQHNEARLDDSMNSDGETPEPSPKRRRTDSPDSSRSRHSSSEPETRRQTTRTRHALPMRRAAGDANDAREGRSRRYTRSRSRGSTSDERRSSDEDDEGAPIRRGSSPRRHRGLSSDTSQTSSHSASRSPSIAHTSPITPKKRALRFKQLFTLPRAHARGITCLKFSPDGSVLATSSADATIHIYSVTSDGTPFPILKILRGHVAGINAVAWSPSKPYTLASASDDKSIMLWTPSGSGSQSGEMPILPSPLIGHHNYAYSLAFSPKGNMLVSGSFDEAVFLWDVRRGSVMRTLPAHSDPVSGVDFLRDGSMVCSCAGDGLIRIWDALTGQCLKTLVHEDRKPVTSVRFTPNGQFVVAWTLDNCIRLWRYTEGRCVKTYQGHVNEQYSLSGCVGDYMNGQEAFVVSGSEDGDVVAWDVSTKEILWRGRAHSQPVVGVDFCRLPDGRGLLVSGGLDRDICVWTEVDEAGKEVSSETMNADVTMADIEYQEGPILTNGVGGKHGDEMDADMNGDSYEPPDA